MNQSAQMPVDDNQTRLEKLQQSMLQLEKDYDDFDSGAKANIGWDDAFFVRKWAELNNEFKRLKKEMV